MRPLLFLTICLASVTIHAQEVSNSYSLMFYNVENLFDNRHDSLKNDSEFLKGGYKNWSTHRMFQKLNGISKVILASNGWHPPSVIGLCEIENSFVLNQLIYHTGLNNAGYRYIHYESPDKRGIDVALLYKKSEFEVLESSPIHTSDTINHFYTRDALYVKGIVKKADTIHIVVNHWPSKRGGALASEEKRIKVAAHVSAKLNAVQQLNQSSKIVVMGDLNAEYDAPSIQQLLKANELSSVLNPKHIKQSKLAGSHKYQGHWALIDHIFVSKHWKNHTSMSHRLVELPFLLEDDMAYSGVKPRRTYAGPRYIGGVSDHLPVILTIETGP